MSRKDDIISAQLEVIRQLNKKNMESLSSDFFGGMPSLYDKAEPSKEQEKITKAQTKEPETKEEKLPEKENIDDLKKELDSYIGLTAIKKEVNNLINMATVYQMRKEHGLPNVDMSLHMVFSGNPGTGKTMIARLMARIYHSLGILSKGQLVEVDRSGLVAGYVGQTATKTAKVLESAMGGVLFIDEAYALSNKSENDYGQEAIDTILKSMEDNRDDLIVIVAGYTELMDEFIHSNPGLESRFNRFLYFEDYTVDEMVDIFKMNCKKGSYNIADDALPILRTYIDDASIEIAAFGNGRGVRNIFENILTQQANRLAAMENITKDDLMLIKAEDVVSARQANPPKEWE